MRAQPLNHDLWIARCEPFGLARQLAARGIQTAVNYPVALPFLPAYRRLAYTPASFPVAYRHQSRILSLPIFPEMTAEQHSAVVAGVRAFGADPA